MSGMAVLVYLLAIAIPAYLLRRFYSKGWYWHVSAILLAFGIGLIPTPAEWKTAGWDLAIGFVFIFLLVWGLGGLQSGRWHREKHA